MPLLYEDLLYKALPKKVQFYIRYTEANPMIEKFLVAIRHNSVSLVKYFLEARINVNEAFLIVSPLSTAVSVGNPVMVNMLLAAGANHNVRSLAFDSTLFHDVFSDYGRCWAGRISEDRAVQLNNLVMIAALLREKGLQLDAMDCQNRTANDVLASSLKAYSSWLDDGSLSNEEIAGISAGLLEKINNVDLSVIRAVNVVAEPPEVVLVLTSQEQQQLQDYKNEQMRLEHNRILRVPIINADVGGNVIEEEIHPALFGHANLAGAADEKSDIDIAALVATIDIPEPLERRPEIIRSHAFEGSASSRWLYGMGWRDLGRIMSDVTSAPNHLSWGNNGAYLTNQPTSGDVASENKAEKEARETLNGAQMKFKTNSGEILDLEVCDAYAASQLEELEQPISQQEVEKLLREARAHAESELEHARNLCADAPNSYSAFFYEPMLQGGLMEDDTYAAFYQLHMKLKAAPKLDVRESKDVQSEEPVDSRVDRHVGMAKLV